MKITISVVKGINKENCDDAVLVDDFLISEEKRVFDKSSLKTVCIADGVGGNLGGKDASNFILKSIVECADKITNEITLKDSLLNINKKLLDYSTDIEDKAAMATTMTGIFMCDDEIILT